MAAHQEPPENRARTDDSRHRGHRHGAQPRRVRLAHREPRRAGFGLEPAGNGRARRGLCGRWRHPSAAAAWAFGSVLGVSGLERWWSIIAGEPLRFLTGAASMPAMPRAPSA